MHSPRILLLVALGSLMGSTIGDLCLDDPTWYRDDNSVKTCANLREETDERIAYVCRRDDVQKYCPFTCDLCGENCVDSSTYTFNAWGGTGRNCTWLGLGSSAVVEKKKNALCDAIKSGSYVKNECKRACENCELENPLTLAPSGTPSLSPKPSAIYTDCIDNPSFAYNGYDRWDCTKIRRAGTRENLCKEVSVRTNCKLTCGLCCEDDTSFTFGRRNQRDCDWIGATTTRKTKLCANNKFRDDKRIIYVCSKTCDTCEDEVTL